MTAVTRLRSRHLLGIYRQKLSVYRPDKLLDGSNKCMLQIYFVSDSSNQLFGYRFKSCLQRQISPNQHR